MGLEFRQRGPSEYVQSLLRRKWLILLPTLAIAAAVAIVVMRLPNVYESSALMVIKPSSLTSVIPVTDPAEMTRKLNGITQIVTSRTSLEMLIKKHGLYKEERARGMSIDAILAKMAEKDVKVELNVRNEVVNGFTISYRGRDPRTAKSVTEELAAATVTRRKTEDSDEGERNVIFFDTLLAKYQEEMNAVEKERVDYLRANLPNLPDNQASFVEQLSGLRDQQKSIYNEIGRLRDQAAMQSALLSAKREQLVRDRQRISDEEPSTRLISSQAYAELVKQRSTLKNELEQMRKSLTDKNPDVISKKEQIANIEKDIAELRANEQQEIEKQRKTNLDRIPTDTPETATITQIIQGLENERKRQEALLGQVEREIAAINQRLSEIPGTKVNIEMLDRRFNTAKANYDAVAEQRRKAGILSAAEQDNRGESIIMQDAANLPQTPVAPKRPLLMGLGVALGLGVGLLLAAFAEAPRFFTIQTMDDAEHYTGLPVLVSLPELMTPEESTRRPKLRVAALAVGLVVALISIPVLVKVLTMTHIFERFVL